MPVSTIIARQPTYTVGLASVANGSSTVTFASTGVAGAPAPALLATDIYTNIQASVCSIDDLFVVPGVGSALIASIDSATQITLEYPWTGPTQVNVAYKIIRYSTSLTAPLVALLNSLQNKGDASNPFGWPITFDDGVVRGQIRQSASKLALSVATSTQTGQIGPFFDGLQIDPATGAVSFPNGFFAPASGMANRIINGGFTNWSGGSSCSIANLTYGYYGPDRWILCNNSFGVAANFTKVAAPLGFRTATAVNMQAVGAVADGSFDFIQRISAAMLSDLDSKACVISFDLNATTTAGALSCLVYLNANTAVDNGTWSVPLLSAAPVAIPVGSGTVSIPAPAAAMAGLKNGAVLYIRFIQTGSVGNPNVTLGSVSFAQGSILQPFEMRPPAVETALCNYYRRRIAFTAGTVFDQYYGGAANAILTTDFPAMRASPSVSVVGLTPSNGTTLWSIAATLDKAVITWPVASAGRFYVNAAAAGAYLDLNAEL